MGRRTTGRADDRRVHASHVYGEEIVRYDRAGKWYIELVPPSVDAGMRRQVTFGEAVERARDMRDMGGQIHLGVRGGRAFDRAVAS